MSTGTFRVWVGCLACYNAGCLRGDWVDAYDAAEFVPCTIPTHEEWWCFDHENAPLPIGETSPCAASSLAAWVVDIEDAGYPVAAACAHLDNQGMSWGEWDADYFETAYVGEYDSLSDFVESTLDEWLPREILDYPTPWDMGPLGSHIDTDSIAHDLDCSGWWVAETADGNYVFCQ